MAFNPKTTLATFCFILAASFSAIVLSGKENSGNGGLENLKDVLITFKQKPGKAESALVKKAGGSIKYSYTLVSVIAASLPEGALNGLRANPNVVSVEEDGKFQKCDAELDNTWGAKQIGAGIVQANGNSGLGVKVAVLDSGIDYNHPELIGAYAGGYDFVNNDNDPLDDNKHGTHVSGTIAAANDDIGMVGVAPGVQLYALKVLGSTGSGSFSDVIAAMQWCVDNGIQVTSNSYGSSKNPGGAVQAAFDNAAAAGIISCAAAGNSGNPKGKGNNIGYPARYASVVAVTATDQSNERPSFSSTGDEAEIAAPGVTINSTLLGGGYIEFNGTSMSTPHVAGTAALIIAAGIADANGDGNINDEVRLRLQETATDLGASGRDPLFGFGLVNAAAAADLGPINNAPNVNISSPGDGSLHPSAASISFSGSASDTEDGNLSLYLYWTSSIDGSIGTGAAFNAVLSDGNHTITTSVVDYGGKEGSDSISITVGTPNDPPSVSITSPSDGATFGTGETVNFTGSASDTEDGDLSASIQWSSNLDGSLGSGSSPSAELSDGTHTIIATVTDSGGENASASIQITVGSPPSLDVTITTNKPSYVNREKVAITIHVTDGTNPVAGAGVSTQIITAKGNTLGASGTTDSNGDARFTYKINSKRDGKGTYTVNATATKTGDVSGSGSTTFEVN